MYARVSLVVEERKGTLVAPKSAVVDFESKRGVWVPNDEKRAKFVPVELGIEDAERIEIKSGLKEGDRIVTTGATAVRNNDVLLIAGEAAPAAADPVARAVPDAAVAAEPGPRARGIPGRTASARRGRPASARRAEASAVKLPRRCSAEL